MEGPCFTQCVHEVSAVCDYRVVFQTHVVASPQRLLCSWRNTAGMGALLNFPSPFGRGEPGETCRQSGQSVCTGGILRELGQCTRAASTGTLERPAGGPGSLCTCGASVGNRERPAVGQQAHVWGIHGEPGEASSEPGRQVHARGVCTAGSG